MSGKGSSLHGLTFLAHASPVSALAWSPGGELLASAGSGPNAVNCNDDRHVIIWDCRPAPRRGRPSAARETSAGTKPVDPAYPTARRSSATLEPLWRLYAGVDERDIGGGFGGDAT